MIRNYYIYGEQYSLVDIYFRIKKLLEDTRACSGLFKFLNEQEAYYTVHFPFETMKTRFCMRVYLSIDDTYMTMFYLQSDYIFEEISDANLANMLTR